MRSAPREREADVRGWLTLILVTAFALRAMDPLFNSPFEDESFMVLMGRSVLTGASDVGNYMNTAFGWYLWPVSVALADQVAGVLGIRLLAAVLGTGAVAGIFLLTKRLFDAEAGLAAAAMFAACTPAILTSRLATHDAASVPLLVFGLVCYVRALQTREWIAYAGAALLFFAAFLVKHPMAAFFPGLCVLAMVQGRMRGVAFAALLSLLVGGYALWYQDTIRALLSFVGSFNAFRAPSEQLWRIYLTDRLDLWSMVVLSGVMLVTGSPRAKRITGLLLAGAGMWALVHVGRRLDYHTWKHAVYVMVFLVPVAGATALAVAERLSRGAFLPAMLGVVVLASGLHLSGQRGLERVHGGMPFQWPNTDALAAYLQPRVEPGQRILVDDPAIRYVLRDQIAQEQVNDQYWMPYKGRMAPESYGVAVQDGYYDYIVLAGSTAGPALALQASIAPHLAARYAERLRVAQPSSGAEAIVYQRVNPAVTRADNAPTIRVESPASGGVIVADGALPEGLVRGRVENAPPGARLIVDVLTNEWYPQGEPMVLSAPSVPFEIRVVLAGTGVQRCRHTIRLRLMSAGEKQLDETFIDDLRRSSLDSLTVPCPGL